MGLIIKVVCGLIIGLISGILIDKACKKFINETEDRLKEYNLNKKIVIAAAVSFTVAVLIKLGWIGFFHFGIVGLLLITIGIIDHYTQYVYMIISMPTIVFSIGISIYFNGITPIIQQIPLFIVLYILARVTSKFYGDIECLIIIGAITGGLGLLVITTAAVILLLIELAIIRKVKKKSAAFCSYLALVYACAILII